MLYFADSDDSGGGFELENGGLNVSGKVLCAISFSLGDSVLTNELVIEKLRTVRFANKIFQR